MNAGSVGLQSCSKSACWAILGPDIQLRESAYDSAKAAKRARESGVPMSDEFATHILNPPMEAPWPEGDIQSPFVPGKNSYKVPNM